eukprot:13932127-Alexandrium_andersonii.AAC.1
MLKQGKAGRHRGGSPGAAPSDHDVGRLHGLGRAGDVENLRKEVEVDGGWPSANADSPTTASCAL